MLNAFFHFWKQREEKKQGHESKRGATREVEGNKGMGSRGDKKK
jgi:hypothetical protein